MAKKVSSRIEKIGDKKYIVERDENGKIICKSPYDDSVAKNESTINTEKLTVGEFRKVVLKKLGYKIKEG